MQREELLQRMEQGRQELNGLLERVPANQKDVPALPGGWSAKDLVGHIGFWERRAADLYRYFSGGPAPDPKPGTVTIDELNARVYNANRDLSLDELIQTESMAYQTLLRMVRSLPEKELFDPQRHPMLNGISFADRLEGFVHGHYQEHLPDLRGWLRQPGWVRFLADGQSIRAYNAHPASGDGPGVVVLHAWWGLNAFFQQVCDRLAGEGFFVVAPDLYDGRLAQTADQAQKLVDERDLSYMQNATSGSVQYLHQLTGNPSDSIAAIGFSMGAGWAMVLAALKPKEVGAVVLFYGTNEIDVAAVRAAFQGHFAESDAWEPEEGVRQLEAKLKGAGREVTFYRYPGTGHWFFESDRPNAFHPQAAQLAWERTIQFLKSKPGDQDAAG